MKKKSIGKFTSSVWRLPKKVGENIVGFSLTLLSQTLLLSQTNFMLKDFGLHPLDLIWLTLHKLHISCN